MSDKNKIGTLWLIGCGNMGASLLRPWAAADVAESIVVVDPALPAVPEGVRCVASVDELLGEPPADIAVIAVKPQIAAAALAPLATAVPLPLVVSIMAGAPIATIAQLTGAAAIVRAMPNTPAAVGKGMTALYAPGEAGDCSVVDRLFAIVGETVWLESESQFDAVTAISGSGPAYLFRFIEALAAAGEAAGLPAVLAEQLARGTVVGAAALAAADMRSAAELRMAVTSPGGTTQAGLEALDADPGLPQLVRNAVRAAAARSRELAENR